MQVSVERFVFPVPPLQELGLALLRGSIVNSATEDIKQTSIDLHPDLSASLYVKLLGIFPFEISDPAYSEFPQVSSDALSNSRNLLERLECKLL
jgi:hypothetical protein